MKALIALAILTTSSVALAQPMVRDHREPIAGSAIVSGAVTIHPVDQRSDMTFAPPSNYDRHDGYNDGRFHRAITLASNASFAHDRDNRLESLFIDVNQRRGLTELRLDREAGRVYIDSVVVMYPNGRSRTIPVRQTLSARTPTLTIDLDRRAITGVYIYGDAIRGRGSFDVIGLRR
jgi:hypothetical protein